MNKLKFDVNINAPREKVWDALWNDATYPQWTSIFSEGSRAESDCKAGSEILFLDGKGSGMHSIIERIEPNSFMGFKHLGEVKDGQKQPFKNPAWQGGTENYLLEDAEGGTALHVEMDSTGEWDDYMNNTFPKALQKLKEVAEK